MKDLVYKDAVRWIEGLTENNEYIEITLGEKLVVKIYRDGGPTEIPLADILVLGIKAYENMNRAANG